MASPFTWGSHDCCLFACDAIEAMTGLDPARTFRGTYDSRETAAAALRAHGGTLAEVATRIFSEMGFPNIALLKAQRGDVALVPTANGDALAIVYGRDLLAAGRDGIVRLPLGHALTVWSV